MILFAISQIIGFTVDNRAGGHHFGIQQSLLSEQTVKITAMTIRPIEHRRDGEALQGYCGLVAGVLEKSELRAFTVISSVITALISPDVAH